MAEITESQETSPSQPASEPQAPNEPNSEANPSSQPGLSEKIGAAAQGVFDRLGVPFKRGRGRPRLDGQPKKSDIPLIPGAEPQAIPIPIIVQSPVLVPTVDNSAAFSLWRRNIGSGVKGALGILKKIVRWRAPAAGIDEAFTDKALAECDDKEALDDFLESLDQVLKKYAWQPKNQEIANLIVSGGRLLAPYGVLLVTFQAEIKRNRVKDLMARRAAQQEGGN